MTLSILIPVYNFDATALVDSLRQRLAAEGVSGEVIVGDDGSTQPQPWLDRLAGVAGVRVHRAPHNLGRAAIRNRLADAAEGRWLWFLDCDTALAPGFSLSRFFTPENEGAPVLCGGIVVPPEMPPHATLRYKYEQADVRRRTADVRNRQPYSQLSTCNLFIRADVFHSIRFDETITSYGHEDTLFGMELEARGIVVRHIANPVVHLGLEPNAVFLAKTETSLRTLYSLAPRLGVGSHLLRMASRLRRFHLAGIVSLLFRLLRRPLRRNLLSRHPSLAAFKLYKMGYFLILVSAK